MAVRPAHVALRYVCHCKSVWDAPPLSTRRTRNRPPCAPVRHCETQGAPVPWVSQPRESAACRPSNERVSKVKAVACAGIVSVWENQAFGLLSGRPRSDPSSRSEAAGLPVALSQRGVVVPLPARRADESVGPAIERKDRRIGKVRAPARELRVGRAIEDACAPGRTAPQLVREAAARASSSSRPRPPPSGSAGPGGAHDG